MAENDTPSSPGDEPSLERLAIRRARDSVRAAEHALSELEQAYDNVPVSHRKMLGQAACRWLSGLGDDCHEVRREIANIIGIFPY